MMNVGDYRAAFGAAERDEDVVLPVCECCGKATSEPLVSTLTGDWMCSQACLVSWESEAA